MESHGALVESRGVSSLIERWKGSVAVMVLPHLLRQQGLGRLRIAPGEVMKTSRWQEKMDRMDTATSRMG